MALEQETILPTNDIVFKEIFWESKIPDTLCVLGTKNIQTF